VLDDQGRVQRTRYELGLWYALRDALRAGRVFIMLGRLAPVGHARINPLGRYRFDNPDGPPGQLRPRHHPSADEQHDRPTAPIGVTGDKH
jgi:hypothetical protein